MAIERKRLGRGLDSLLSRRSPTPATVLPPQERSASHLHLSSSHLPLAHPLDGEVRMVAVSAIHPNPYQPRLDISTEELHALAASIRKDGLLQPVVVRWSADRYELIAGERRWRASIEAGLEHIPAVVKSADQRQMLEWALIENLQRSDLNPVERAKAYERYCREFQVKPEELAEKLCEDRTTVVNYLRLLDLSDEILKLVASGQISMGHARSLLSLGDPHRRERFAQQIVRDGLSVRATESMVKDLRERRSGTEQMPNLNPISAREANLRDLENRLQQALGTRVQIKPRRGHKGRIVIDYHTLDDFERITRILGLGSA